jgi:hypothetical protein
MFTYRAGYEMITPVCQLLVLLVILYSNVPAANAIPNLIESLQGNYDPVRSKLSTLRSLAQ